MVMSPSLHNYLGTIQNPRYRSYCERLFCGVAFIVGYLDFGEMCADKCIQWFRKEQEEDRREHERHAHNHYNADYREYSYRDNYQQNQPKERSTSYDPKHWE